MVRPVCSLGLLSLLALVPNSARAQWGRHFSIAAGPSIGIDGTPPDAGVHVHVAGALAPGPRALNLLADGYFTWMAPGTNQGFFFGSTFVDRHQENQFGIGLSGIWNILPRSSVCPYLLVGVVSRWSDVSQQFVIRDESGQLVDQSSFSGTEHQFDLLLGLGAAMRWGSRRLLLEGRLYGGSAINMPITLGLTF